MGRYLERAIVVVSILWTFSIFFFFSERVGVDEKSGVFRAMNNYTSVYRCIK